MAWYHRAHAERASACHGAVQVRVASDRPGTPILARRGTSCAICDRADPCCRRRS
jgi:hypothetical protein